MGFMDKFKDAAQQAQISQQLRAQSVNGYKQKIGEEVVVNVDPDDPQSMLLWG